MPLSGVQLRCICGFIILVDIYSAGVIRPMAARRRKLSHLFQEVLLCQTYEAPFAFSDYSKTESVHHVAHVVSVICDPVYDHWFC